MKTIINLISLIFLVLINIQAQSDCILIKYIAPIDLPISKLLICQSSENYFNKDTSKTRIDIDTTNFKIIEDYIITSKFIDRSKCNSQGEFGSYLIEIKNDDSSTICYILDTPKKSEKFLWGLVCSLKNSNEYLDFELRYRIKRIIGYVKYEKKYEKKD